MRNLSGLLLGVMVLFGASGGCFAEPSKTTGPEKDKTKSKTESTSKVEKKSDISKESKDLPIEKLDKDYFSDLLSLMVGTLKKGGGIDVYFMVGRSGGECFFEELSDGTITLIHKDQCKKVGV
jgi:hypothetical protein